MTYSRLIWEHTSAAEPVEILSEYDPAGWERRKVERFPDGSVGYAGHGEAVHGTDLSLIPRPPDAEVASDPEFRLSPLTAAEFEAAWRAAQRVPTGAA